jgi:hypothetical protein
MDRGIYAWFYTLASSDPQDSDRKLESSRCPTSVCLRVFFACFSFGNSALSVGSDAATTPRVSSTIVQSRRVVYFPGNRIRIHSRGNSRRNEENQYSQNESPLSLAAEIRTITLPMQASEPTEKSAASLTFMYVFIWIRQIRETKIRSKQKSSVMLIARSVLFINMVPPQTKPFGSLPAVIASNPAHGGLHLKTLRNTAKMV